MNVELKDRFLEKVSAVVKAEYDKGVNPGVLVSALSDLIVENFDVSERDAHRFSVSVVSEVVFD